MWYTLHGLRYTFSCVVNDSDCCIVSRSLTALWLVRTENPIMPPKTDTNLFIILDATLYGMQHCVEWSVNRSICTEAA